MFLCLLSPKSELRVCLSHPQTSLEETETEKSPTEEERAEGKLY